MFAHFFRGATIYFVAAFAGGAFAQFESPAPVQPTGYQSKPLAHAKKYMVAAAHPLAVETGVHILDRGGSATDAAIAVQLVLNLVEPQASGIGGGAFIMHYDAKAKTSSAYDGRETAPMASTPDLFLGGDGKPMPFHDAVIGGRSVGVPGVLRAMEMAHARHGKLPWAALFTPAIQLAEQGFPLTARVYAHLRTDQTLPNDVNARAIYYAPDGVPKPVGTILKNPPFAAALKRIAKEGPDAFYLGKLAVAMVAAVRGHATNPGTLSLDDLRDYRARSVETLCRTYRAYTLCGPPPPSGAASVFQLLQLLERFDMQAVRPNSAEAVHLFSEAGRLAFADRERYLGDPQFVRVPLDGLTDPAYNRKRSELIHAEKTMGRAEPGVPANTTIAFADGDAIEQASTSHLSIVDGAGNAISMTSSIEGSFGSRVFVHGFFLNNELTDFSMLPTRNGMPVANAVYPGKRPRSAMSPLLIFDADKKLRLLIGSPGGPAIINFVARTLVAHLDWGLDIQAAISLPHFGSRNGPTELERDTSVETLAGALQAMGHDVRVVPFTSGLHGIAHGQHGWEGGADPRREGIAKGR